MFYFKDVARNNTWQGKRNDIIRKKQPKITKRAVEIFHVTTSQTSLD